MPCGAPGDGVVTWGDYFASSAVGCNGPLNDTMQNYFRDESFRYVVTDNQLKLTSSDGTVELTLRAHRPDQRRLADHERTVTYRAAFRAVSCTASDG
jgi:hypothetical protein